MDCAISATLDFFSFSGVRVHSTAVGVVANSSQILQSLQLEWSGEEVEMIGEEAAWEEWRSGVESRKAEECGEEAAWEEWRSGVESRKAEECGDLDTGRTEHVTLIYYSLRELYYENKNKVLSV